jgi:hypothetical protein
MANEDAMEILRMQPKMDYAKVYEDLYDAERDKVAVLEKRIAELEGLLSNDTGEWKSAAFQKIKGLESFCRQLIEALEQISENPFWDQCHAIAKKALASDLAKRLKGEGK